MSVDPVCKMEVGETPFSLRMDDTLYHFCSKGCLLKFKNRTNWANNHTYQLIIIGGGPAGLTAAVYASMLKIDTYFLAKDIGGQAVDGTKIRNYMGYDFITGRELIEKFQDQFIHTNYLDHKMDEALHVKRNENG